MYTSNQTQIFLYVMYIARQVSASLSSQTNYPVSTYNHDNLSGLLRTWQTPHLKKSI